MAPKLSSIVNAAAFISSSVLIGLSIAAIFLASDAYDAFTNVFPPGSYAWLPSRWYSDDESALFNIFIHYNRSSEIKTYVAAGLALFVGLLGTFVFGASFQVSSLDGLFLRDLTIYSVKPRPSSQNQYLSSLFSAASLSLSAPYGRRSQKCGSRRQRVRSTAFVYMQGTITPAQSRMQHFRHARYMVIPIAALSLVLTGLYAMKAWNTKVKEDDENGSAGEREGLLRL